MADISLDLDPTHSGFASYKDLLVVDNDLCLTSDANAAGANPVLQDILQTLRFFLGEWFLNNTEGVPYFQQILVKNPDQSKIDAIFSNLILGRPGVEQLSSYNFTVNNAQRILDVSFRCVTTRGVVNYSGSIATGNGGSL